MSKLEQKNGEPLVILNSFWALKVKFKNQIIYHKIELELNIDNSNVPLMIYEPLVKKLCVSEIVNRQKLCKKNI